MTVFTKDGQERETTTPAEAVKLKHRGWREVAPAADQTTDNEGESA